MPFYREAVLLRLCNAGMMCVAIGSSLVAVFLTSFSESLGGFTEAQLGLVGGGLFSGFVLGILVTGPLADRIGVKLFALLGTGITAAGLVFLADAFSLGSVVGAAFAVGLGAGVTDMAMSPIVSSLSSANRGEALNRLHAFYCAGAIGTLLVASALIYLELSWRLVLILFSMAPAAVCVGFALEPVPPLVPPGKKRMRLRELVRQPAFHFALLGIALAGAAEEGMAQWLPAYAERDLGFSKAAAAVALGSFATAMGLGRWLASRYARMIAPPYLVAVGALICGIGFIGGAAARDLPMLALAACVLTGLGCSVLWPTSLALASDTFPRGGASLFAAMAAAGNAGCLIAPLLCGLIAEQYGLGLAIGIGASYPLLLAALAVYRARTERV